MAFFRLLWYFIANEILQNCAFLFIAWPGGFLLDFPFDYNNHNDSYYLDMDLSTLISQSCLSFSKNQVFRENGIFLACQIELLPVPGINLIHHLSR